MPKDNIDRAIKKGTGELAGGAAYEEVTYEGYGPAGVAVIVDVMTDNKNRTVAEIRHILSKHGGNLGENGCVAWMFKKRGYIALDRQAVDEEGQDDKGDADIGEIVLIHAGGIPVEGVHAENNAGDREHVELKETEEHQAGGQLQEFHAGFQLGTFGQKFL